MTQVTEISVTVEHNGKPYIVVIPEENKQILLYTIAGFCKGGVLQLAPMPEGCEFRTLADVVRA